MKILIVEDDLVFAKVLEKVMSRYGTCDLVGNGQAALDSFIQAHESNCPYDLILMDIMMPGVDGLQSVSLIREKETFMSIPLQQRVKIIMTTALRDPRTVMKALYESDANSYLQKPVTRENLEDEMKKLGFIS